jgi:hypothetical protein
MLAALSAPATAAPHGFHDEGLRGDLRFSLGFMKVRHPADSDAAEGARQGRCHHPVHGAQKKSDEE